MAEQRDLTRYELEISPTEDFNSVILAKRTAEQKTQVTEPLEPGSYYWRLKAYDSNGRMSLTSVTRKMNVTNLAGPPDRHSNRSRANQS